MVFKLLHVKPQIALPEPCSTDLAYSRRVLPDYVAAIEKSGGEVVHINSRMTLMEVVGQITSCSAVLLPSCPSDVDPQKYKSMRESETVDPDPLRDALDELLLRDAYHLRKPIFGICYGLQSLNVWRDGKLDQCVGKLHQKDHAVPTIDPDSLLASAVGNKVIRVNSKHRQAVKMVGNDLRVTAKAEDGVIEAVEGTAPDHYVMGLQWHPERDFDQNGDSRKIFLQFIEAAKAKMKEGEKGQASDEVRIAGSKTAKDWKEFRERLEQDKDNDNLWAEAFESYFYARLSSRYLEPINVLQKNGKFQGEGFSITAIHCSLIEFLESTIEGRSYRHVKKGKGDRDLNSAVEYGWSEAIFIEFLTKRTPFNKSFDEDLAEKFYKNIRCGLLHEARTKDGWRILAQSPKSEIISANEKIIYRDDFHQALLDFIQSYKDALLSNSALWEKVPTREAFIRKFDSLCS